jgi:hypothetical protein
MQGSPIAVGRSREVRCKWLGPPAPDRCLVVPPKGNLAGGETPPATVWSETLQLLVTPALLWIADLAGFGGCSLIRVALTRRAQPLMAWAIIAKCRSRSNNSTP